MLCRYFVLSFLLNVLLSKTLALPLTGYVRRQAVSSTIPEPTSTLNITHEIQTIETTQLSTAADGITVQRCTITGTPTTLPNGEPAVIIAQNCSSSFIPTSHSSTAPVASISSVSLSSPSDFPSSSTSSFSSPSPPASSSSPFSPTAIVVTSVAPPSVTNSVSESSSSPASSSSFSTSTSINNSINTSSSVTNNDASGGHLSSLPIFLGAFGGVATLALIIVGCTVYRPFKYLNNARLNTPACIRRMKRGAHRDSTEKQGDIPAPYAFKTG